MEIKRDISNVLSNGKGKGYESLPTSIHRQADRIGIATAYHRVRATHESQ